MRTGDIFAPAAGGSRYAARKSKKVPHFRGFLAPPTFPVERSTMANCRSPSKPLSVTSEQFSSSPIMDFTG